ncbi:MAG TPA: molybdopterin cofactor-binding domain-containing protein, partial [Thermomicrobiaceae bacterium]|nr:molybdopterin cofactor-binding domain-containing protein [Thermomicrobiaceae bacterium]
RPAGRNATLLGNPKLPAGLAGSPQVVTNGNFVGVVATDEWAAIQAASQLDVKWHQGTPLLATDDGTAATRTALKQALQDSANTFNAKALSAVGDVTSGLSGAATTLQATYFTPYQMHAAIGPSCAVADVRSAPDQKTGIQATIWSGTQGVYQLQGAIAKLLGIAPAAVHVIYAEASGCYGHNGADDAAADAALLSQAAGAPVRVQWMRPDEDGWEPLGPAMVHEMQGGLDQAGKVAAWEHTLWTQTHSTRPGGIAGNLLAGQELGFAPQPESPTGLLGGRNSIVNYAFRNSLVTANSVRSFTTATSGTWTQTTNLFPRTTALRTLGGFSNTFANESFVDELAMAANADPLAFRQQYLSDPRGLAVLSAVAKAANWKAIPWPKRPRPVVPSPPPQAQTPPSPPAPPPYFGRGIAYVQYENSLAYVATYAEVLVDPTSGAVQVTRVIVAHDCGLIINPDGLTNQIQGNVIQATSRTLKEEVLFDSSGVTSLTWAGVPTDNTWSIKYKAGPSYPILHFNEVPSIQVLLLDQPTKPAWGAGEPASETMGAAIGNAIYFAIGVRLRELPFTPANVLAAWQAALARP